MLAFFTERRSFSRVLTPKSRCFNPFSSEKIQFLLPSNPSHLECFERLRKLASASASSGTRNIRRRRLHAFTQGLLDAIRKTHLIGSFWEVWSSVPSRFAHGDIT